MSMKYYIITLLIYTNVAQAEIYKCVDSSGKTSFSDKVCLDSSKKEIIDYKKQDWTIRLKAKKPSDIEITKIESKKNKTLISYKYINNKDSNEFIRLANKLSNKNVKLLKLTKIAPGKKGKAEILVSNEENKLFNK